LDYIFLVLMGIQVLGLLVFVLLYQRAPGLSKEGSTGITGAAALDEAGVPLLGEDSGSDDYEVMSDIGRVASLVHVHRYHSGHHSHSSDISPELGKGKEDGQCSSRNDNMDEGAGGGSSVAGSKAAIGPSTSTAEEGQELGASAAPSRPALQKVQSFAIHDIEAVSDDWENDGNLQ
jgi:hypothetical protein